MKKISQNEIKRYLEGYLAQVKYWSPDQGDSFLMLNCREILANHEILIMDDLKKQLYDADNQVLTLSKEIYEEDTSDVEFLRLTAEVISNSNHTKAA
jgi:hypothetical protein